MISRLALGLALALLATDAATAAANLPAPTASPVPIVAVERSARLNRLKTSASAEIDRRLNALETASSHLEESVVVPAELRQSLAASLQTESDGLSALKSKLSSESDLAAARQHVQAVLDEYKVYGLLVPRANLVSSADRLQNAAGIANRSLAKTKQKIDALDAAGRNTRDLYRSYEQAMTGLSAADARIAANLTALSAAPAPDYVVAHKALATSRDELQAARDDLSSVRANLESMIAAINALK